MTAETPRKQVLHALAFTPVPIDLLVIIAWTASTVLAVYAPFLSSSPLRVIFGLPMVLFIPGYALIAALFPGKNDLDGIERLALSFGLSIAVVPLIGLALNYTPWGIRLDPVLASLSIFTLAMGSAAHYRRAVLTADERFVVPFRATLLSLKTEFLPAGSSRIDRVLSIILLIAIVAAIGATIFVIVVPKEGEHFTEFYILGQGGKAADYPSGFSTGTQQPVIIGIGNHEYRTIEYTIEVLAENRTFSTVTNTSTLHAMVLLNRFPVTVAHNATVETPFSFTVDSPQYNSIEFLLFNGTPPGNAVWGDDRVNASYRDLHLWVTVSP
ncbi:MAG: DUF1616 domain-containing protein [Methanomicrobiales archaeon]|nr:DUF1616 domain-containing protein [Methanomicrobiales archaeon]